MIEGLNFLSRLLHDFYKKKPFILVDEYDHFLNYAIIKFPIDEREKSIKLFSDIFSRTFKTQDMCYTKALVTGILRIAKESIFSGCNNFIEFGLIDKYFASYYGFTEDEVNSLFDKYNMPLDLRMHMKLWYNGYLIGGYKIYNPWSIVQALAAYEFKIINKKDNNYVSIIKDYWVDSGNFSFVGDIFKIPEISLSMLSLIKGDSITLEYYNSMTVEFYLILKEISDNKKLSEKAEKAEKSKNIFFSFLFSTGYLTISKRYTDMTSYNEISSENNTLQRGKFIIIS